jgi:hypothetical protein
MVRPLTIALLLFGCAVASSAADCQLEKVRGQRA